MDVYDGKEETVKTSTENPNFSDSNSAMNFQIAAVNFKAPPFWRSNPELWFKQVEAQFVTANIRSDSRQFYHIVAAIESEILAQVSDIILSPPTADMYLTLKTRIIDRFSESENARLKKLLTAIELGDQRPSHLLREMRDLASGKVSDDVLRTLWLQRLPTQIKAILTASGDSLINLAVLADKISEVVEPKGGMSQILSVSNDVATVEQSRIDRMETQLLSLSKKIDELGRSHFYARNARSRTRRANNPVKSRENSSTRQHELCWYHFKFGENASKCREPCNFSKTSKN